MERNERRGNESTETMRKRVKIKLNTFYGVQRGMRTADGK